VFQPSPLKRNLVLRFERRGAARKPGIDTTKTFTGKIESQYDWNENSLSLWSSWYSLLVLCPIVWSERSITRLVVVDKAIWLQWAHSVDDGSVAPSYNFSSTEVRRDSLFSISNVKGWCLSLMGHFYNEMSFCVWSDTTFAYLARRMGWILETFLRSHKNIAR
jgi:hypothetical protein